MGSVIDLESRRRHDKQYVKRPDWTDKALFIGLTMREAEQDYEIIVRSDPVVFLGLQVHLLSASAPDHIERYVRGMEVAQVFASRRCSQARTFYRCLSAIEMACVHWPGWQPSKHQVIEYDTHHLDAIRMAGGRHR